MSDAAASIAPVVAAPVAVDSPPVAAKTPEAEPSDEYEIDGRKVTLTRTQARTMLQKAGAVDKRMQETAETKKKLDALVSDFEKDPETALAKMGKDPEKILQALMERRARNALLTPEQREAQALKEERDALKAEKEAAEKEKKAAADKVLDEYGEKELTGQLIAAADKHGLDHSPEALEEFAKIALELIEEFKLAPTADQVAQEVIRQDLEHLEARERKLIPNLNGDRLKSYLKLNIERIIKLPATELLEALGPEGIKAFQAATLTKVTGPAPVKRLAPAVAPPPRNGSGRFISEGQFDKKFGR